MSVRVTQHKRGWWMVDIRVRAPSGVVIRDRKKAPVTSRSGAQRWGETRERHLAAHGTEVAKPVPTLAEFWPEYWRRYVEAEQLKASTRHSIRSIYRTHLVPKLGAKRLDEIGAGDVQEIKAACTHLAPKTVNNVLMVLSGMLTAAQAWGEIKTRPEIGVLDVMQEPVEFYEEDVLERLREGAARVDPRAELIVLLGADAGLRAGEMVGLEWGDVDFGRNLLTIRRAEYRGVTDTPKGGRSRMLEMTARLATALKAARHVAGDRVLRRNDGERMTWAWLRDRMKAAQRQIGGVEVNGNLHILRHTFCSRLAMAGVPARTIQDLAGHATIRTTERYMHLSPLAGRSAIRVLDGGNMEATSRNAKAAPR